MVPKTERFEMRVDEDLLTRVDDWRREQGDVPARAEAMRRLVETGLGRSSRTATPFSDGEKLIFMMLRDVLKHLKVKNPEIDADLVSEVIWGGHYWALSLELPGLFHDEEDDQRDVRFVFDVLVMWDSIERGYERLSAEDKAIVTQNPLGKDVKFRGFDGNGEAGLISIARFVVEKMDRFERFKGREFNAHHPAVGMYERMLGVFQPMLRALVGAELGAAEILKILEAAPHPQS